ncbi:hypothetical protein ACHAWF_016622 [Thalassiosira exigua]
MPEALPRSTEGIRLVRESHRKAGGGRLRGVVLRPAALRGPLCRAAGVQEVEVAEDMQQFVDHSPFRNGCRDGV